MKPTDVITLLYQYRFIPQCACDLRWDKKGNIEYLHPTRGWKKVALSRILSFLRLYKRAVELKAIQTNA